MSLATVLSTIKVLILDCPELPASFDQRLDFFQKQFPGLEQVEAEDLAKIDPEKMKLYTQTIFAGERSVLRNHFPITFALIRAKFNSKIDFFTMVQNLHSKRPWKSYLTSGLVNSFLEYLTYDRPDILDRVPEIIEVATIERLSLDVARRDVNEIKNPFNIQDISKLTVSELLDLNCEIVSSSALQTFSYDTTTYRKEFYENERKLPKNEIQKKDIFALGSRDKWHNVCWNNISESLFEFLKTIEGKSFKLGELADAFVAGENQNIPEQELFQLFLKLFSLLLEDGALVIKN